MKWNKEDENKIVELLKEGNSYDNIAEKLNRSKKSVKEKLNRLGFNFESFKDLHFYENKKCIECEKEFKSLKSEDRKFCSQSCSASFNNKKREIKSNKKCLCCNIDISDKKSKVKFCSYSCSSTFNNKFKTNYQNGFTNKKDYIISKCLNCEINIEDKKDRSFCSLNCQHEHQWKLKKEFVLLGEIKSNRILRKYKIEEDGHICQLCKRDEWNNKKIPLVLDHIDGNPYNNFPSNLRMICPNCDAQTETYKGKNKGKGRFERMKRYYEGKSF